MTVEDNSHLTKWYILKSLLTRYKADETLAKEMDKRHKTGDENFPVMDYYVPHLEEKRRLVNGVVKDVSSPLGGYAFLRGTLHQVNRFCLSHSGFNKIRGLDGDSAFLSIRDKEMENFKLVVRAYNARHQNAPFISSNTDFFEEGDTVRILEGDFRNVQGTFITSRGKDSGYVVVRVCRNFYVTTLEVKSSQLQIIAFSDKNHHVYQQLDSFSPVLLRVTGHFLKHGSLDDLDAQLSKDKSKVERFVVRFGSAEIKSRKMQSRVTAYILLSRFVLRRHDRPDDANTYPFSHYINVVRNGMDAVTNPVNLAFINAVLYAATGISGCYDEALHAASQWTAEAEESIKSKHANDKPAVTEASDLRAEAIKSLPLRKREVVILLDLLYRYFRPGVTAVSIGGKKMMVSLPDKTYSAAITLRELLSAFPHDYLTGLAETLDLKHDDGTTPNRLAACMLGSPGKLYSEATCTKSDSGLLEEILSSVPDKYIVRKAGSRPFRLQTLGLVATYVNIDNDEWHMLMPADVRNVLTKYASK